MAARPLAILGAAVGFAAALGSIAGAAQSWLGVAGFPTGVATAADGTLFVSESRPLRPEGTVVAYRRTDSAYAAVGSATIPSGAVNVALTPDGGTVLIATRVGIAALDAGALRNGTASVNAVRDGDAPRTNRIVASLDGAYAYFTNQGTATLGVAAVDRERIDGSPVPRIVAHVQLDRLPGGLALSHDGRILYVTSEIAAGDPRSVPGASDLRLGRLRCAANLGAQGVLAVIDTRRAVADPAHAVIARIAAGCAPVRVALSPDDSVAWVTVQGESRVLAFGTAALRSDPGHALRAEIPVGDVPVGLAVSADGRTVLVANSHRAIDRDLAGEADLSVIDAGAALAGRPLPPATLAAGTMAREVVAARDGTFLVTDFRGRSIEQVAPPYTKENAAAR